MKEYEEIEERIYQQFKDNSDEIEEYKSNYQEVRNQLSYELKASLWKTAFGLQKVDSLSPSEYMVDLAVLNINDKLNYSEVYHSIKEYHGKENVNDDIQEADIVSLRIVELLSENYFRLSPATLKSIHYHLFKDVLPQDYNVGEYRTVNITKDEPVLGGRSVQYSSHFMIEKALEYDFNLEKKFNDNHLIETEKINHYVEFIANLWQIHPFREGNTRTIAVFTIQYLRDKGYLLDNQPFQQSAQYFRDSLVLYNDTIKQDKSPLINFFNIVLNQKKDELQSLRKVEKTGTYHNKQTT